MTSLSQISDIIRDISTIVVYIVEMRHRNMSYTRSDFLELCTRSTVNYAEK